MNQFKGVFLEKIVIRNAKKEDIDFIMDIEYDSFSENVSESREVILSRISVFPDGFLILEVDGIVSGYVSSEIWEYHEKINEDMFDLDHDIEKVHNIRGTELYISSIGVLKKYRGKGYGKLLFSKLIENIMKKYEISSMILTVSANWDAAVNLYKKSGFKEIAIIKEFFEDESNSDGILMRKYL